MENKLPRRSFIKAAGLTLAGSVLIGNSTSIFADDTTPSFSLPALPYATNALEPFIDTLTMEIHHGKHHKAYVDNLNKALVDNKIIETNLNKLLGMVSKLPISIRNNGGGHYNHSMFWKLLAPNAGGDPKGTLGEAIESVFASFDNFRTKFNEAAASRFGSGWAWLVVNNGKLEIGSTPNQDNPLMDLCDLKGTPILALDIWEHAYYLKYQNRRADYTKAYWNLINWEQAEKNFLAIR